MEHAWTRLAIVTLTLPLLMPMASAETEHQPLSLTQALALLVDHPQWQSAELAIEQAKGEQIIAQQYQNPNLEVSAETRDKQSLSLAFPLETNRVRHARLEGAEAGLASAMYEAQVVQRQLSAQIKQAYFLIQQRTEALTLAEQDLTLLASLRYAIQLKVSVGEAPKYELVKAEAEFLGAQIERDLAYQQLVLAKELLAEKLGLSYLPEILPAEVARNKQQDDKQQNDAPLSCRLPSHEQAKQALQNHPLYLAAQTHYHQTQAELTSELALVTPQPTLIVGTEQDMGIDRSRLGVSLPLPLWHQRDGQIATATAKSKRANTLISNVERELSIAWTQASLRYQVAETQVNTYQNGLLKEAESAFRVAQAAYKHGERGILDYIDAQRTLATVKRGFINSQYEQKYACIDIEQLTAY